jgi:hypothetical protein
MQLTLWDAETAGAPVGAAQTLNDVAVANGVFTVDLNQAGEPGVAVPSGATRWLEVAVKCPGDALFTLLTPRQALTTPSYELTTLPTDGRWTNAGDLSRPGLQYTSVYTHHLTLSPAAFTPIAHAPDHNLYTAGASGGSGNVALAAPIELPDDATITSVRLVALDNANPADVRMRIDRYPITSNSPTYIAILMTTGASSAFQSLTSSLDEVVDNVNYYYYAIAFPSGGEWSLSNTTVKSLIITYTVRGISGVYLPLVKSRD